MGDVPGVQGISVVGGGSQECAPRVRLHFRLYTSREIREANTLDSFVIEFRKGVSTCVVAYTVRTSASRFKCFGNVAHMQ